MNLNRDVFLVAAGTGAGKSYSVVKLVLDLKKRGVPFHIIDHDRGLEKVARELGVQEFTPDEYTLALEWPDVELGVEKAMTLPREGWLIFEMVGRLWDLVQSYYSERVYGHDPTEHLLELRAEAESRISAGKATRDAQKERMASTAYGGFEGRTDWGLIKRLHNDRIFDRVLLRGDFNILSTTSLTPAEGEVPFPFTNIRLKPEGEKHQVYRHDTIAILTQKGGRYYWQTDLLGMGKDRGRQLHKPTDCTGEGFIESYYKTHNLEVIKQ